MTGQNRDAIIKKLIEGNGTPLEIAFPDLLKANLEKASAIMSPRGWRDNIFYSYKTNPVAEVLKQLHSGGAGAEVVSERELDLALSLGVKPDRIVFNGIYKSQRALEKAVEIGIKCINIDAPRELEIIEKLAVAMGRKIKIGLRVRTKAGWQGQFGYVIADGSAYRMAKRIVANEKLEWMAVHFHLGTSNYSAYRRAIKETLLFIKRADEELGANIRALDIGGGFPGKGMRLLTIAEQGWLRLFDRPWPFGSKAPDDGFKVLEAAAGYFQQASQKLGLADMELWIEPGRLITGDTQVLAVRVVGLRRSGKKHYAIVDGGRVGAAGPLVGETRNASVLGKSGPGWAKYDIVGPTCMPWDRLFAGIKLPVLQIGDIVLIEGAGAYFVPMETEFSFDKPKFVMV
jgi:diaminopimelate decarboxylase